MELGWNGFKSPLSLLGDDDAPVPMLLVHGNILLVYSTVLVKIYWTGHNRSVTPHVNLGLFQIDSLGKVPLACTTPCQQGHTLHFLNTYSLSCPTSLFCLLHHLQPLVTRYPGYFSWHLTSIHSHKKHRQHEPHRKGKGCFCPEAPSGHNWSPIGQPPPPDS